jgi:hypothetical protein
MSFAGRRLGRWLGVENGVLGRNLQLVAIGCAVMALLVALAMLFLALSLYQALSLRMAPAEAALVVAATTVALVPIVAGLTRHARDRARRAAVTNLRVEAVAKLAPPALSLVARNGGAASLIAVAAVAYLMVRRR